MGRKAKMTGKKIGHADTDSLSLAALRTPVTATKAIRVTQRSSGTRIALPL